MRFVSLSRHLATKSHICRSICSPKYCFSTVSRQTARSQSKPSRPPDHSDRSDRSDRSNRIVPSSKLTKIASARLDRLENAQASSSNLTSAQKREAKKTYVIFRKVALAIFDTFLRQRNWSAEKDEYVAFGVNNRLDFEREAKLFRLAIDRACDLAGEKHLTSRKDNPLFWSLRNAFVTGDSKGLNVEIAYAFRSFLMRSKFPNNILATHQKIADMRYPAEWFPATRALQRTIHLHVGPTNSGKTYHALKALENAKTGIYAGPLRLLAHEVYTRFLAKGKDCALITGEEQRIPTHTDIYYKSCTVEMTPVNQVVDVAVIDEIQMIGDADRGWAWTQAFFGVQAKEVHLCGEERAVELIQSLCAMLGDKCVVHHYKRLSGLETMHESLNGRLENLQKGDAVVSFSRLGIHALKTQIEQATGKRVAIVYGSLPPDTRAQQAALFNDPDNDYDFLVASDAIGMGLNLEIRRVVFEGTTKRDGYNNRQLTVSELKQIGGRAGRYKSAQQAIRAGGEASDNSQSSAPAKPGAPGLVTALDDEDLAVLIHAFNSQPPPLETAGVCPPTAMIERMAQYFPPNTPLSFIIVRLRDIARLSHNFHFCNLKEMLEIADLIQPFPMSIYDRCVFLNAPAALRDSDGPAVLQSLARCVSAMEGGDLVDIPEINLELLDEGRVSDYSEADHLRKLESLHKSITLYLWLSYRFSGVFRSQALAFHVKDLVEEKISDHLSRITMSSETRRRRIESMRRSAELAQRQKEQVLEEGLGEEAGGVHEGNSLWHEEEPLLDDPSELDQITRLEPRSGQRGSSHTHGGRPL
ncbi:P-loop containing nucleoside triphosphate hydrolase protein [Xylariaceae sp. FL0594]|nr:P-loop containing nucleoside triphosphate hydrolase protein [Xylariaceae sp. FL0594]